MNDEPSESASAEPTPIEGEFRTLYDVLMVSPQAPTSVLHAAYRALARIYHPDIARDRETARKMQELNEAYEVLRDSGRRASYDHALRRRPVVGRDSSWKGVRRQRTCWWCRTTIDPFAAYCGHCHWTICGACRKCGCEGSDRGVVVMEARCDRSHPAWLSTVLDRPTLVASGLLLVNALLVSGLWLTVRQLPGW